MTNDTEEPSAASAGSVRPFAWAVCNPVGTYYRSFGYHREALECCLQKTRETGDCFYVRALYAAPPQDGVVRLPPLDPNGAPGWNAAIGAAREALADAGG
jgi:hypothetical protein